MQQKPGKLDLSHAVGDRRTETDSVLFELHAQKSVDDRPDISGCAPGLI
jgi:hypothetical protein